MAGVPHRSLGRKVQEKFLRGFEGWHAGNIPPQAIDEFRDGDDLETSLWDDGEEAQHRRDVWLSLILSRRSIGPLSLALLWQDDNHIGEDLGRRIIQSDGDTPYLAGNHLHYHVSDPSPGDSPRLVLAAGSRNEIPSLTADDVRDVIEDAYLAHVLPNDGLNPTLSKEITGIIKSRFVEAEALRAEVQGRVFDIRNQSQIVEKIVGATMVAENEIGALLHRRRIGSGDVFTLYCDDGTQSRRVARTLRRTGKKPRILIGGFAEWTQRGFETEAPISE